MTIVEALTGLCQVFGTCSGDLHWPCVSFIFHSKGFPNLMWFSSYPRINPGSWSLRLGSMCLGNRFSRTDHLILRYPYVWDEVTENSWECPKPCDGIKLYVTLIWIINAMITHKLLYYKWTTSSWMGFLRLWIVPLVAMHFSPKGVWIHNSMAYFYFKFLSENFEIGLCKCV